MTSLMPSDKPLLVIDVDTTIYDHRTMVNRAFQYKTGQSLPVIHHDSMDPSHYYDLPSKTQKELQLLSENCRALDYWNNLPILDDAKTATEQLQKQYQLLLLSFVPSPVRASRQAFYRQHGLDAHYVLMIDNPDWRSVAPELQECPIITAQSEWKKDPHAVTFTACGGWKEILSKMLQ